MLWAWALLCAACTRADPEVETWLDPVPMPPLEGEAAVAGGAFHLADARGKAVLLALGYGHCTDVCPRTLSRMSSVHDALGADAGRVALLYVSVDGERDGVSQLRDRVKDHPGVEAIAPEPVELPGLLAVLQTSTRKRLPDVEGNYGVDHSPDLFAIDPQGRLRARFGPRASDERIRRGLVGLLGNRT